MKKCNLVLLTMLISLTATAQTNSVNKYTCKSLDDNQPFDAEWLKLSLYVNSSNGTTRALVAIADNNSAGVTALNLDPSYKPKTPKTKMFDRYVFTKHVGNKNYAISPIYLEKSLKNGGKKLRNGSFGGYLKTSGHGYSLATYICFRKN